MTGKLVLIGLALSLLGAVDTRAAAQGCTLMKIAELPVTMQGLSPTVIVKINGADAR